MNTPPAFFFGLYLLIGAAVYLGSEPYRPKSKAAFDACFQHHRGVWVIMVLLALCIWPLLAGRMALRFILPKKKDQDADR